MICPHLGFIVEWNHNCHTGSLPTTSSTYSPARSESNFGSTFRRCASRDIILLFCTYFPVAMSRYGTSLADGAKSDLADVANHVSTIVEAVRYFARWNEPRLLFVRMENLDGNSSVKSWQ